MCSIFIYFLSSLFGHWPAMLLTQTQYSIYQARILVTLDATGTVGLH